MNCIQEDRKWDLIFKQLSEGLNSEEEAELFKLESEVEFSGLTRKTVVNLIDYENQPIGE